MHSLQEYISLLDERGLVVEVSALEAEAEKTVEYISYDSGDLRSGTMFVCKGAQFYVKYLKDALEKGAFVYVSEVKYESGDGFPCIIVNDIRKAMAAIAGFYYNYPREKLVLTGVTGSAGKSTTVYFMRHIIDAYMKSLKKPESAVISSIDTYDGIINEESHVTTPEAFVLHRHFDSAVKSGIEYMSMEVSSQALKYHRTMDVIFDAACFLNIGIDHISDVEHSDFDDYLNSKLLIFRQCKVACVNMESDHFDRIFKAAKEHAPKTVTFGLRPEADFYAYDINVNMENITFKVRCGDFDKEFDMAMAGLFNVENALAAITAAHALKIPYESIFDGVKTVHLSGRMEMFRSKKRDVTAIVNYAHNLISFEALFKHTQKQFPDKKISILFGCAGKKALGRRREMGGVAGKYADKTYITEDDPGEEDLIKICEEIAVHVKAEGGDYEIVPDRGDAIKRAIDDAEDGTVILVTGKGRETRQKRGKLYVEVISDVEYVQKFLD